MIGKGFDCRIGCAALLETMRRLANEQLNVDLVGVLSSQEEVGERGVHVAVNKVKPQIALCFEGCPADDTFTEPYAIQTEERPHDSFSGQIRDLLPQIPALYPGSG